jgi:hypothetical protein
MVSQLWTDVSYVEVGFFTIFEISNESPNRGATRQCAGGVEFLSSGGDGGVVIGFMMGSEGGRGRRDRINAYCSERLAEHFGNEQYTDSKGAI